MKKKKKKYIKPQIKRIKLDAKTAVLAVCKVSHGVGGPGNVNCRGFGGPYCFDHGS
jgi:hypothetical protein